MRPSARIALLGLTLVAASSLAVPRANAGLEIFGCTVWVIPWEKFRDETLPCVTRKLTAKFEEGKNNVLGWGVDVLGCKASLGNIPGTFDCLRAKIEKAATDARDKVLGQPLTILGCSVSIGNPAGAFQCLKDKAAEEFKKGIGGMLALIEQARPVLECTGVQDVLDFSTAFFRDPGAAVKSTFDKVKTFVDGIGAKIAVNGAALGAQILSLVGGTQVPGAAVDQIMSFVWNTADELAKFSGPAKCLMSVVKQHKSKVEPVARTIVTGIINAVPSLVNAAKDLLAEKVGAPIIQKLVGLVLGKDRAARLKDSVTKNLRNDLDDHAAALLGSVLDAIRNKAPNVKQLWLNARAAIHGTEGDFGVRKLMIALSAVIEELGGFLVEEVSQEITKWLIRGLDTAIVNLTNRLIDGICGLIPEVGAMICTAIGALSIRVAWNQVVQFLIDKALQPTLKAGLAFLPTLVAKAVTRLIMDKLTGLAVKGIDTAVANDKGVAWASVAVTPFINFFIGLVEGAVLPGIKQSIAYTSKLAELGDMAVAMALKENIPARQATPVVAMSGTLPLQREENAPLMAVQGGTDAPATAAPGKAGKRGTVVRGSTGSVRQAAWRGPFANQLIHCGVVGSPKYATVEGCRLKSGGPGCLADGGAQCSFPRAQARALCDAHGQCAGFTCSKGAPTCQARDAAEARNPVANPGFDSEVSYGMSAHMGGQLINCGVKGKPDYGTGPGCRIKDGPGCSGVVPGQCTFPVAQAMAMCMNHPRCRGITCGAGRGDCQARDADEAKTLVPHPGYGSRVAMAFTERDSALIQCGVKGQASHATLAGCRIKSGPGCTADGSGQCGFPRARAEELCLAHPQCRGFTCGKGAATCQARDGDEVSSSLEANPGYSSSVGH